MAANSSRFEVLDITLDKGTVGKCDFVKQDQVVYREDIIYYHFAV